MNKRPIHENLDTAFVNLSALLRYLRRRDFVGAIHVELSGYEADIVLLENNKLEVREHDRISGRVADGEEALQRLLIRAREPGGIINVFQKMKDFTPQPKPAGSGGIDREPRGGPVPAPSNGAPQTSGQTPKPAPALPAFPFQLSNQVEEKARAATLLAPPDWQTLLQLTGELLAAVEHTLAAARLNFPAAFAKARAEIAEDYPFLDPAHEDFAYQNGQITMPRQISAAIFTAGTIEALRRVLEKLAGNPKFASIYTAVRNEIGSSARARRPLYDKFAISAQIERLLNS